MAKTPTSPKPSGSTPTFNQSNTSRAKLLRMGMDAGVTPKGAPTTRP